MAAMMRAVPTARGRCFAARSPDWLLEHATDADCATIHLDSGSARQAAQRLRLRYGFELNRHHFALSLTWPVAQRPATQRRYISQTLSRMSEATRSDMLERAITV